MKVSIYSLSASDKTPEQVVELAQKYGCEGIEWWCREKGHIDTGNLESSAKRIVQVMRDSGLEVAGLAPYFKFSETEEEIKETFGVARIIGAKNIRCHSYSFTGETPVADLMRKQRFWLAETVLPVAERFGVRVVIEQHHYQICCTPNACRQLVEGLPVEMVGVIWDPGNSLFEGYSRPEYALSVLGKYLAHVHIKSAKPVSEGEGIPTGRKYPMLWGKLADGDLDWDGIITALYKVGYQGFLSLEDLDQRPSETKIIEDIPYLRNIIRKYGR